jgi:hypothetical protein
MRRSFGPLEGVGTFLTARLDSLLLEVKLESWIWERNGDERVIHLARLSWLAVYGFDCYCFWHCDLYCRSPIEGKRSFNPECGLGIETL